MRTARPWYVLSSWNGTRKPKPVTELDSFGAGVGAGVVTVAQFGWRAAAEPAAWVVQSLQSVPAEQYVGTSHVPSFS